MASDRQPNAKSTESCFFVSKDNSEADQQLRNNNSHNNAKQTKANSSVFSVFKRKNDSQASQADSKKQALTSFEFIKSKFSAAAQQQNK